MVNQMQHLDHTNNIKENKKNKIFNNLKAN